MRWSDHLSDPEMVITSVELIGLRSRLAQPASFSWGSAAERNVGLLRVELDRELIGWGETSVTFPLWSLEERALTVREGLAPLVVGRTVATPRALVLELQGSLGRLGPLWSEVAVQSTIGALEIALFDAVGKVRQQPIWQLLANGRPREPQPLPLYAVGFSGQPAEQAQAAGRAVQEGFSAVKVRAGFGLAADEELIACVADAVGDGRRVLVDANMGYDRVQARELALIANRYGAGWLEEPLRNDDIAGLADLRRERLVRIAAGENAYGARQAHALIEAGAVDVIMPDLARCGGLSEAASILTLARSREISYSLHHYASDVGFAAAVHVCAAFGDSEPLLRDVSQWPLRTAVLREPLPIRDGRCQVPRGPGLGIEVNQDALDNHRIV